MQSSNSVVASGFTRLDRRVTREGTRRGGGDDRVTWEGLVGGRAAAVGSKRHRWHTGAPGFAALSSIEQAPGACRIPAASLQHATVRQIRQQPRREQIMAEQRAVRRADAIRIADPARWLVSMQLFSALASAAFDAGIAELERDSAAWTKWTTEEARQLFDRFGLTGPIWALPATDERF
jgi:hypothetical protein